MKRLRPSATAGAPGSVAPITSKPGAEMCARYHVDGSRVPRGGSLASSGLPLAVRVPSTTQLFDPSPSPVPACRKSATAGLPPESAARTAPSTSVAADGVEPGPDEAGPDEAGPDEPGPGEPGTGNRE